jgi:hypothetical protein
MRSSRGISYRHGARYLQRKQAVWLGDGAVAEDAFDGLLLACSDAGDLARQPSLQQAQQFDRRIASMRLSVEKDAR